jgi:hypothetical protein
VCVALFPLPVAFTEHLARATHRGDARRRRLRRAAAPRPPHA